MNFMKYPVPASENNFTSHQSMMKMNSTLPGKMDGALFSSANGSIDSFRTQVPLQQLPGTSRLTHLSLAMLSLSIKNEINTDSCIRKGMARAMIRTIGLHPMFRQTVHISAL
jgi:hypothetical protein